MVVRLCVIHSCRDRFTTHPTHFPPKCYQSPNPSGCVVSCFCITSDSPRAGSIPNIYMSMCVCVSVCNTVRKRKRNGRQEIHTHTFLSWNALVLLYYYFLLFCVHVISTFSFFEFFCPACTDIGRPSVNGWGCAQSLLFLFLVRSVSVV